MAGIRLVTDSAADLDPRDMAARGIAIVPLDVRLGDIGPEVTRLWSPEEFWLQCSKCEELPETSAPSPGAFQAAFEQASKDGAEGVVCVTLSSKLSATYQAALAAAESMAGDLPIRVVDSLSVTMGEGLAVLAGFDLAESGAGIEEVQQAIEAAMVKIRVYGTFETLDNLRRGGRIGSAQALFGSLLSIKPVIEIRDGVVEAESRQRTRRRSLEYVADKVKQAGPLARVAVMHAAANDVDTLVDLLAESFPRDRILVTYIGPVIGSHAGPGTVGVCYQLA
ncbi:MAG: DegV family protein [Acidimicrobiales bacterium]